MKRIKIEKSALFLAAIVLMGLCGIVAVVLAFRTDPIDTALENDLVVNMIVVIDKDKAPYATELFLYYPVNGRGALLDVPAETGLIIKSLNRVDQISVLYRTQSPGAYFDEIKRLTKADLPYYIILSEDNLSRLVDILDAVDLFIPNRVETTLDGMPAYLPSGNVTLDGDKLALYATYSDPEEADSEATARRQKAVQSLIKRIAQEKDFLSNRQVLRSVMSCMRTNLPAKTLERLFVEWSRLDADRIVLQRTTGALRKVEGKELLFPHYDGELVRDIVKQTLNALVNSASFTVEDKVVTLGILNGTAERGLAKKTAEIFQSFGYEVVSIDNAPDVGEAKTRILDRFGSSETANTIAGVIKCRNVERIDDSTDEKAAATTIAAASADFIIILGDDFNGRYCVY